MTFNSLSFRLFAFAAAWTLFVLPLTALLLISVYRGSVENRFDDSLKFYLLLLARAEPGEEGQLKVPELPDPLFKLDFSGRYWQVKSLDDDENKPPVQLQSESLLDEELMLPSLLGIPADQNLVRTGYVKGPESQKLRVIELETSLGEGEASRKYSFAVARDSSEIEGDLADFTAKVGMTLTILGLGLILAPFVQIKFGLWPLRAISSGLASIRSGKHLRGLTHF